MPRWILVAASVPLTVYCGGKSSIGPTPVLTVASISPSSGPSIGGTHITVTGSHFPADASLTIGGISALNVAVVDTTTITAITAPSKSGSADLVVSAGGVAATLPGGFTYLQTENSPPVIASITARGMRPNEPASFADLGEEINVDASISDEETPIDDLTYEWSATGGTLIDSGRSVKWRAPADLTKTPVDYTLTLTVSDRYQSTDETGAIVTRENRVTGTATVHVHNSLKEVRDLAGEFLIDFSNVAVTAETAVRNFSDDPACGKTDERRDIETNRAKYSKIRIDNLGFPADVSFNFLGTCSLFGRRPSVAGDACVTLACSWTSTFKDSGLLDPVRGKCYISEIYEDQPDRWRMCWSEFQGFSTTTGKPIRGLSFGR